MDAFTVGLFLLEAIFKGGQQGGDIDGFFQLEIILIRLVVVHRGQVGENAAQVDGVRPVGDPVLPGANQVGAAHQFIHGANPQLGHDLPQLLGNEQHEIHHIFRLPLEPAPQGGILGGNAHGAGVQIAHPHHHAAHGHQRRGGEAELLRPQHTGDGHIPSAHQLAVGFQPHPGAQAVANQSLVGFRQTQLPGQTRVVDGALGCRAGAAVIARNQHTPGTGLGHTGGNGAHTSLGHQLHGDTGVAVGILQIVNQLRQILDGINVVVGRGRDQGNAGGGAAGLGNPGVHLLAGQMAALAGLRALGHLDLDFLSAV